MPADTPSPGATPIARHPEVGDAIQAARRVHDASGLTTAAILAFLLAMRGDARWTRDERVAAAAMAARIAEWERADAR